MIKSFAPIFVSTYLFSCVALFADAGLSDEEGGSDFPILQNTSVSIDPVKTPADLFSQEPLFSNRNQESDETRIQEKAKPVQPRTQEVSVKPFTGKVKGRKVRMRAKADLDSKVVKELEKNDLLLVVGEKGNFWAVEAPHGIKGYVFRSFVLDNVVEGNHVNVRLEPSLDSPIIGRMNSGEEVKDGVISAVNQKWLEITPPPSTRFYIAKEYVEFAGGPEIKVAYEKKREMAEQLLDSSTLLSKAEMKKRFEEIDFDRVTKGYHTLIEDFSEFPDTVEMAKEALATFQEEYLQKRISHLDIKKGEEVLATNRQDRFIPSDPSLITDKMHLWDPIEEALFLSWSNINGNRSLDHYYEEQKLASVELSGFLEPYTTPVKNRPGDFLIRENDIPVAYVYSTQVNLQNLVGTHVRLVAAPRPNNNFAFPAYYVLAAE